MTPFNGQAAIVTGASPGIGLAIAQQLVAGGARVCITGRKEPELQRAVALLGRGNAVGIAGHADDVDIEQLRLLVLKTAWLMDRVGNRGAHSEIQAIKIATPRTVEWVLDKAIQVHGAAGLSQDLPLAAAFATIRTLRFADGPDEVHKNALAKSEIGRQLAARQSHHTSTEERVGV